MVSLKKLMQIEEKKSLKTDPWDTLTPETGSERGNKQKILRRSNQWDGKKTRNI